MNISIVLQEYLMEDGLEKSPNGNHVITPEAVATGKWLLYAKDKNSWKEMGEDFDQQWTVMAC